MNWSTSNIIQLLDLASQLYLRKTDIVDFTTYHTIWILFHIPTSMSLIKSTWPGIRSLPHHQWHGGLHQISPYPNLTLQPHVKWTSTNISCIISLPLHHWCSELHQISPTLNLGSHLSHCITLTWISKISYTLIWLQLNGNEDTW